MSDQSNEVIFGQSYWITFVTTVSKGYFSVKKILGRHIPTDARII